MYLQPGPGYLLAWTTRGKNRGRDSVGYLPVHPILVCTIASTLLFQMMGAKWWEALGWKKKVKCVGVGFLQWIEVANVGCTLTCNQWHVQYLIRDPTLNLALQYIDPGLYFQLLFIYGIRGKQGCLHRQTSPKVCQQHMLLSCWRYLHTVGLQDPFLCWSRCLATHQSQVIHHHLLAVVLPPLWQVQGRS